MWIGLGGREVRRRRGGGGGPGGRLPLQESASRVQVDALTVLLCSVGRIQKLTQISPEKRTWNRRSGRPRGRGRRLTGSRNGRMERYQAKTPPPTVSSQGPARRDEMVETASG